MPGLAPRQITGVESRRGCLELRTAQRYAAAPLIDHDAVAHQRAYDEDVTIEEKSRNEARWFKRHRQKVTMQAAARFVAVQLKVGEERRPEGFSARVDQRPRKML